MKRTAPAIAKPQYKKRRETLGGLQLRRHAGQSIIIVCPDGSQIEIQSMPRQYIRIVAPDDYEIARKECVHDLPREDITDGPGGHPAANQPLGKPA